MIDLRPVLFIVGMLLSILAVAMLLPMAINLAAGHEDWTAFLASAAATLFAGVALSLTTRSGWQGFRLRQAFLMTTAAWLSIACFGALPFAFSEIQLSYTDAFFEAMSGVTTTGSTVIVDLDTAPPGLLFWRAMLQWLGGIGIIVMAISILPMLRVGGMQMFRIEAFEADKVMPRAAQMAAGISFIYVGLTVVSAISYGVFGMSLFDSVTHAMTSIATGGFSTRDASFAYWTHPGIHWTAIATMIAGSVPFVLYLQAVRGRPLALWRDSQVRWMLAIMTGATAITAYWVGVNEFLAWDSAVRHAAFNTISVMTGTGYASADFNLWGGFVTTLMLALMFVGGCAGSTTCGIKVFRFQILYAEADSQLRSLIQPNGIFIPHYAGRPIPQGVVQSVMAFFFLYGLCFFALASALGLMGLDFVTAFSGAATALNNVGPGLGEIIGPTGNFLPLPDAAKWLLSVGMLLGRLELFTVLVLLIPSFWRS